LINGSKIWNPRGFPGRKYWGKFSKCAHSFRRWYGLSVFKNTFGNTDLLTTVLNVVVCLVLFGMMILTALDVILRYLFNSPILGVLEITEFMMVVIVFFSLAYTQSAKKHVAVDFLVIRLSKRKQRIIDLISYMIYVLLLMVICWKSISKGLEIMETNEVSGTLSFPVFPFFFVVALGCAAMGVNLLRDMRNTVRQIRS
jgi:TRAP-type C4-dicarboxylate transport system permease small subunit